MTPPPPDNLLRRLARVNPTTAFVLALALLLGGMFAPGIVGAALLFTLGAALAALTFTTWPVQTPGTRVVRLALLAMLFAAVLGKAL